MNDDGPIFDLFLTTVQQLEMIYGTTKAKRDLYYTKIVFIDGFNN
jgi:hypothetical protein